jgi:hypothetical protein
VGTLNYQRLVIGYHGCDEAVASKVLVDGSNLEYSTNKHDWLGKGVYFWEHGPERALEWARQRMKINGRIKKPAVVGAFINLGNCFDLLDVQNTMALQKAFPIFQEFAAKGGGKVPVNEKAPRDLSSDLVLRFLDCAVINWYLDQTAGLASGNFQTVRCVFAEGETAFPGSKIMLKSHIQIAVRDPNCILGYFRPKLDSPTI